MNLFSLNSPFARGINKLVMMLYVGILWFLCSLPILTMGAATAALYEVLFQAVKDQEGYIARRFFQAFRGNLKQGLQLGIPLVLAQVVFAFDFFYYSLFWGEGYQVQTIVFAVLSLLVLTVFPFVFAAMAKFGNTASGHFRMAVTIMLRCPGWTAAVLAIQALTVFLIWFFVYFPALFIMGISGYLEAVIFDHVFQGLIDRGIIGVAEGAVLNSLGVNLTDIDELKE
ncbi:MAG: YesL family protein [Lachnospiraceae bacterium]|nr:YesL family protein [uncultured Acetatifactor sp.]MCI9231999.1 YesL family protein [Lachnospiraceae bacterium]MCI9572304.1 YesL family protein [Lachnospiraceae bacterium]